MAIAKLPCRKNPEPHAIGESGSPKIVQKSASGPSRCPRDPPPTHFLEAGFWTTS